MAYVQEKCPACGGPLPAASLDWLTCKFCGAELRPAPGAQYHIARKLEEAPWEPNLQRVSVAGVRYAVLGKLASGASSEVFLARKDERLTETVVLKIARSPNENARLEQEWKSITALEQPKRQGGDYFTRLLPQRVLQGKLEGTERVVSVFRWRAGFQFTFEHAREEYPGGVDGRAAVWMWKRVLDMLTWLHDGGWSHGAIEPSHLILHPRDHGVILCGFSAAKQASSHEDVAASARAIAHVLGGDERALPSHVPPSIEEVVLRSARAGAPALSVKAALDEAAQVAYGPPRYHRFTLSGWG